MTTSNIFHIVTITQELQRIADFHLTSALGLKSVQIGEISAQPTSGILDVVPGIWIQPMPATENLFDELPRVNLQKYFFRFVYVRLIGLNENLVKKSMVDSVQVMNTYADKIYLQDITNLPSGTNILWQNINKVEWRPSEDAYLQQINADLAAIAFQVEVVVKTRRSV